jgi:phosphatidylserine decarboxylase
MREVINKEDLITPKSVKFLYDTKVGNVVLWIITRRFVSKIVGKYLDSRLSCSRIKKYVKNNNINMDEFEFVKYKSFNDFFTRKIKKELRPFCLDNKQFPSPCDGKVSAYVIKEDNMFNIKGYDYTVNELIKDEE